MVGYSYPASTMSLDQYIAQVRAMAERGQSITLPASEYLQVLQGLTTVAQQVQVLQQRAHAMPSSPVAGNGNMAALAPQLLNLVAAKLKESGAQSPLADALQSAAAGKPGAVDNLMGILKQVGAQPGADPLITQALASLAQAKS